MPTIPPLHIQIERGINHWCKTCRKAIDKRSIRCRTCHQRQLMSRRYPLHKRPRLECVDCGCPISHKSYHGHGRCRNCYFDFKRLVGKPKRSLCSSASPSSSIETCYEDKDGCLRYASELLSLEREVEARDLDEASSVEDDIIVEENIEQIENQQLYRVRMCYTVGNAWGALRRCWKEFKIARNAQDYELVIKYAKRIQRLEQLLNIQVNNFDGILPPPDGQDIIESSDDDRVNTRMITMSYY